MERSSEAKRGQLLVVGTGIRGPAQITVEARSAITSSDRVLSLVADPLTRRWLTDLVPEVTWLEDAYAVGRPRDESYEEMVRRILEPVVAGQTVCAVFYGHPGVFAFPSHEAIRRARALGHPARMLPGIAADACLFADLGLDPGVEGCQSFEATDFLLRGRIFDPTSFLVLWQVGVIAVADVSDEALWGPEGLAILVEVLLETYPPEHEVVIYEAPTVPLARHKEIRTPLAELASAGVTAVSTLLVPPLGEKATDLEMARRLRMIE